MAQTLPSLWKSMKSPWTWNRTRLCHLTGKKSLHPVTFYAIQLSVLSPRQKDFFLACLKLQVAERYFEILSVANMWVVGLAC